MQSPMTNKSSSTANMSSSRQLTRVPWTGLLAITLLCHVMVTADATVNKDSSQDTPTPGALRPECRSVLGWVPYILKRPFSTLLNSAYCPSWMSRHLLTKKPQYSHLDLPEGVPFAFFCGVCYPKTSTMEVNVTVTQTVNYSDEAVIQQKPVVTADGDLVHQMRGQKCRIVYAITEPLQQSGSLQCKLNYGTREYLEPVTYSIQSGTTIINTEETMEVSTQSVRLSCPSHPVPESIYSPMTNVWFYPSPSNIAEIAELSNNPHATFTITDEPLVVACATYHLLNSSDQVAMKTYTVRRVQPSHLDGCSESRQNPLIQVLYSSATDSATNEAPHNIEIGNSDNGYQFRGQGDIVNGGFNINISILFRRATNSTT